MHVILNSGEDMEVSRFTSQGIDIESRHPEAHFSALQMFGTSLALCTYSVLRSYGEQIEIDSDNLALHLSWSYAADPFRIGHIEMDINWPELPESRLEAARRAAAMCTLHNTLAQPPEFITRVERK